MKLLMTTDCIGGVWTYALDLARALGPHGAKVHLATMGAPLTADQRADAAAVPNVTVHESGYRLEWMAHPWEDVRRAGRWLLDLEHEVDADIVHLNGYAHGALPFRAPVVVAAHSCVMSWFESVTRGPAPADWDRYRRAVAAGLRAADLIVAPTRWMLDAAVRHHGPLPHTRVIYNGRDGSLYRRGRKENCILAAGRMWDEAKNIAALNHVAGDLHWPVYVAGAGVPSGAASAGAGAGAGNGTGTSAGAGASAGADAGAGPGAGSVRPLGRLDALTLAGWFARADIYCLPARYEPFGLSALEAAMSGCALVLGDIPSLREVWGDAAAFVDPDDLRALRARLSALIDSPAERLALAARAQHRAREYTLPRMGAAYLGVYEELLRGRRALAAEARADNAWITHAQGTTPG